MAISIPKQPIVPQNEVAAERYAYVTLEHREAETGILAAIEADLQAGLSPERIGSIWRRVSSFENMPQMVEMAARYIRRGME